MLTHCAFPVLKSDLEYRHVPDVARATARRHQILVTDFFSRALLACPVAFLALGRFCFEQWCSATPMGIIPIALGIIQRSYSTAFKLRFTPGYIPKKVHSVHLSHLYIHTSLGGH